MMAWIALHPIASVAVFLVLALLLMLLLAMVLAPHVPRLPEQTPEPPKVIRWPPPSGHKTPWKDTRR